MSESVVSREIREAGEAARQAARWADPLTLAERVALAVKLTRGMNRCGLKEWNSYGTYSADRVMVKAELRDLIMDVNGRTGACL
jgi:hypothetical protein